VGDPAGPGGSGEGPPAKEEIVPEGRAPAEAPSEAPAAAVPAPAEEPADEEIIEPPRPILIEEEIPGEDLEEELKVIYKERKRGGADEHHLPDTPISAADVKKLRDETGAGMMDCKRALTECGGDVDAAKDLLRTWGLAGVRSARPGRPRRAL